MRSEREIKAALIAEMWKAREALLWSLRGVPFMEPGHGEWLTIVGVQADGALVESADNPGESRLVPRDRCEQLVQSVVMTGLGPGNEDGWERKVGGGFIYNWPSLVLRTGWSYEDLRGRGVAFCIANRRKGGEEFWVRGQ